MKKLPDIKLFDLKEFYKLINIMSRHLKTNFVFCIALIMYIFLAIICFNYYQTFSTDSISYISIAQYYAVFDFPNAINGYWSPLISWLLSPFLLFGSTKIFLIHSAEILSLIIGFFTLIGVKFLFSKFIIEEKVRDITLFTMVPIVLYFAVIDITPDLLLACILLFYLGLIFDPSYSFRLQNGFACGVLGALAYFSKTYAFIFFICHFILFNLFFYFSEVDSEKKNRVKRNLILGLTVFLALSGIWAGVISDKYGELTIGTSGTYNLDLVGPESNGTPVFYQGLVPRNNNPVNTWDYPSYFHLKHWNPLSSFKSFLFELNLIGDNILKTGIFFLSFSFLSLLILLISMIFLIKNKKDETSRRKIMYLLITILIYLGGYWLIVVELRYLYLMSILIFLLGVYLFEVLYKNGYIKSRIKNVLLVFLILSFLLMPLIGYFSSANLNENFNIQDISYTLKDDYQVHGNLASNSQWVASYKLTYYLNGTYYGQTERGIDLNELESELKDRNIDYYLVWETSDQIDLPYKKITKMEFYTGGKIWYLEVYSIKNDSEVL